MHCKDIYLNHILHDKTSEEPKEYNFPKLHKLPVVVLCVARCDESYHVHYSPIFIKPLFEGSSCWENTTLQFMLQSLSWVAVQGGLRNETQLLENHTIGFCEIVKQKER